MLLSIPWVVSQLLSYDPLSWLAFIGVAALAAYRGRWLGVICGHVCVALLVCVLDVIYQGHHSQTIDLDFAFHLGVLARVALINMVLLPVSVLALWLSYRKAKPSAA